ncbi:MAG: prolipoprotein diacylglyceryl transferase [Gammaproteobacteria bacterium]
MIAYPDIDPIAFQIGPLAIRWYGLAYVAGIGLVWGLLRGRAKRSASGWSVEQVDDLLFYVALGVVLGGRLGHVLFYDLPYYVQKPLEVFKVWHGGMSFHGGLLGLFVGTWLFARKWGKRFWVAADFLSSAGPISLFLGRMANFVNGELWGTATKLPWGMVFPDPRAGGIPRHPSQLYEAFLEGIVLFVALWIYSRRPRPAGSVTGWFLLGYGVFRFAVEFVREPDQPLGYLAFGWLTMGQALSFPMILAGACLLVWSQRKKAL